MHEEYSLSEGMLSPSLLPEQFSEHLLVTLVCPDVSSLHTLIKMWSSIGCKTQSRIK